MVSKRYAQEMSHWYDKMGSMSRQQRHSMIVLRLALMALLITGFGLPMWTGTAHAQDPQFSQYYAAPVYLNPAFVGASGSEHRAVVNHRLQWPNLPQAFRTYAFSYEYNMAALNSAFGLMVVGDKAGSTNLRSNQIGGIYSFKVRLEDKLVIAPALYFGYGRRTLDYSRLIFGDQLAFDAQGSPTIDPAAGSGVESTFFDFGAGMLLYNKHFWLGYASHHLNNPNISLIDGQAPVPTKHSLHGGLRIPITYGRSRDILASIAPSFNYRSQGAFDQLDLGFYFYYDPIVAGLWYRGIPLAQHVPDNIDHDAITFMLGVKFDQFDLGYSYDVTVSGLGATSGGAHEISLAYQFQSTRPGKIRRKEKFLPCPSF